MSQTHIEDSCRVHVKRIHAAFRHIEKADSTPGQTHTCAQLFAYLNAALPNTQYMWPGTLLHMRKSSAPLVTHHECGCNSVGLQCFIQASKEPHFSGRCHIIFKSFCKETSYLKNNSTVSSETLFSNTADFFCKETLYLKKQQNLLLGNVMIFQK